MQVTCCDQGAAMAQEGGASSDRACCFPTQRRADADVSGKGSAFCRPQEVSGNLLEEGEVCRRTDIRVCGVVLAARKHSRNLLFADLYPSIPPVEMPTAGVLVGRRQLDSDCSGPARSGGQFATHSARHNSHTGHDHSVRQAFHVVKNGHEGHAGEECGTQQEQLSKSWLIDENTIHVAVAGSSVAQEPLPPAEQRQKVQLIFDFAHFRGFSRLCDSAGEPAFDNAPDTSAPSSPPAFLTRSLAGSVDRSRSPPPSLATIFKELCALLAHRGSYISVLGNPARTRSGELSLSVSIVTGFRAPPAFEALSRLCKVVHDRLLSPEILAMSTRVEGAAEGPVSEEEWAFVEKLLEASPTERRRMLKRLCCRLTGRREERMRPPSFKRKELAILESTQSLRSRWPIHEIGIRSITSEEATDSPARSIFRGAGENREHYMKYKKLPQIQWMVAQVREVYAQLVAASPEGRQVISRGTALNDRAPIRCIDVGGGRGDLAFALASTFPRLHVTVVDVKESSLDAARQRAAQLNLRNIDFVHCDFSSYSVSPDVSILVGLHACGGLADCILSRAAALGVSFIVSTCCFAKHPDLRAAFLLNDTQESRGELQVGLGGQEGASKSSGLHGTQGTYEESASTDSGEAVPDTMEIYHGALPDTLRILCR